MCGLVAVRAFAPISNLEVLGHAALDAIAHRGPDASDSYVDQNFGPTFLGHRRLAILDLTDAGLQPMRCHDSGNVLIFNGEIYNFVELRRELEGLGHIFRTQSDAEVILHAWQAWGEDAFARFNGMWAIVLLDRATGDLVFCRDRLGVKPLYIARDSRVAVLASEIRSIAEVMGGYPKPNRQAVFDFLILGISEHREDTFYEGISVAPPGWVMRLSCTGRFSKRRYHDWPEEGSVALSPNDLHELVTDSVRLRLRSDAPTVSLLSGGLDSSIITAISARSASLEARAHFVGAFTYGYSDQASAEHDETAEASAFLATLSPPPRQFVHRSLSVPDEDEMLDLVATQEQPFCTPSIIASYRIYRAIRAEGFKVALVGEGADELFGGYTRRYLSLLARDRLLTGQFSRAARLLRNGAVAPSLIANRLIWDLPIGAVRMLLRQFRPSARIMADGLWNDMAPHFDMLVADRRVDVSERLRRDVIATNLPMILRFADRNSMHFGVEARSPYLDYRIVSAVLASPVPERMGENHGKLMLRRAFARHLPEELVWKPKVRGFGNAEQFQVARMRFDRIWEELPDWVEEFVSLPRLKRELRNANPHPTLWWSLSIVLWLSVTYGRKSGQMGGTMLRRRTT